MRIIFLSNYFNHHQRALCDALNARCERFTFAACGVMREDRRALGYGESDVPDYVIEVHDEPSRREALARIADADVVILGGADQTMTKAALSACRRGKLTFRYSERLNKTRHSRLTDVLRGIRLRRYNPSRAPLYLLSVGPYAAMDYQGFGLYRTRAYLWGYFPAVRPCTDLDALMDAKDPGDVLWVGRMIGWKHPADLLYAAKGLAVDPTVPPFRVTFVGTGPLEEELTDTAARLELSDRVTFAGAMKPDAVRDRMEKAAILVSTSDKNEGWGAVINEGMSSGCAVIAPYETGAGAAMIRDGENGRLCPAGSVPGLQAVLRRLLCDPAARRRLGMSGMETITAADGWNAENAASRLVILAARILAGETEPDPFPEGLLSRVKPLKKIRN